MEALKVTLFAVMMFCILEGIPYLFFAFCAWDINWLPDAHWLFRAFYGITALSGLVVMAGTTCEYSQDQKNE